MLLFREALGSASIGGAHEKLHSATAVVSTIAVKVMAVGGGCIELWIGTYQRFV